MHRRYLGLHELLAYNFSQYLPHNLVSYVELEGHFNINKLIKAIELCVNDNIQLNYSFSSYELMFVSQSQSKPQIEALVLEDDLQPSDVINYELNTPFCLHSAPLSRFKIYFNAQKVYIFSTFHHSIIDGIPASLIYYQILDIYFHGKDAPQISSKPIINRGVEQYILPKQYCYKKLAYKGSREENRITKIVIGHIDADSYGRFLTFCKNYNIRPVSCLSAICNMLVAQNCATNFLQFGMLYNIRGFMDIPISNEQPYFASASCFIEIANYKSKSLIEISKEINSKIYRSLKNRDMLEEFNFLSSLNSTSQSLDDLIQKIEYNNPSVFVSNLGQLDSRQNATNYGIKTIGAAVCTHFYSSNKNKFFLVSSVLNGELSIMLHYVEPLCSRSEAESLCRNIIRTVSNFR